MKKKKECILGLDLVLVRSGVGVISKEDGSLVHYRAIHAKNIKGLERLDFIVNSIRELINEYNITHAVIEGYSMYGSGRITDLAEVGGIIKYELHKNNIPFSIIAPKTMVKNITGHGNLTKDDVRKVVNKRLGIALTEKEHDESDALGLALCKYDEFKKAG